MSATEAVPTDPTHPEQIIEDLPDVSETLLNTKIFNFKERLHLIHSYSKLRKEGKL